MKTRSVVLTFESVDENPMMNDTSLAVLSHDTVCFSTFYKMIFGIFLKFSIWHC